MAAPGAFRGFAEHRLQEDGLVLTTTSRVDFFVSYTLVFHLPNARAAASGYAARLPAASDEQSSRP
jgi:hypothetical protein